MSVFDNLEDRLTGMKRLNDFGSPVVALAIEERRTGKIRDYTLDANTEHELSAKLSVRFWANSAQINEARKVAERSLAHLLYADVLAKLQMIEHAISDGDQNAAFDWCGKLRSSITR